VIRDGSQQSHEQQSCNYIEGILYRLAYCITTCDFVSTQNIDLKVEVETLKEEMKELQRVSALAL
jgi:hypothetical protein